jgi:GT2 family glycosyltransferase
MRGAPQGQRDLAGAPPAPIVCVLQRENPPSHLVCGAFARAIIIGIGTAVIRKPPPFSVIIVCCNSAEYLRRCLEALETQTFRDFEIIVVDNASTDGSTDRLHEKHPSLPLRVERLQTNAGTAAANNLGALKAASEWLALLNPHALPDAAWLEQLMQAASQLPGAFFASRQIQANRPKLLEADGEIYFTSGLARHRNYNVPHYTPGPPREVFSASAAAALFPRQQFLEAGAFDEDYFACQEDVDLGFRLRLRGLRCYLVPSAIVYHDGVSTPEAPGHLATYLGQRNLVWTYFKNMPSPWVWLYLPLHIVWGAISLVYFTLRGQGPAIVRATRDALRGLRSVLQKRKIVQATRSAEVQEVLRAMNRNPLGPLEGIIDRTWPDEH